MLQTRRQLQIASRDRITQTVFTEKLRVADPGGLDAEGERRGIAPGVGDPGHLHPTVLLFVAAVEPSARQELPIGTDRGATTVIAVNVGLVLSADAERFGDTPRRTDAHRVALKLRARRQRGDRGRQSALHDHRATRGRIQHLRTKAESTARRAAREAAAEATGQAEGRRQEAVALCTDDLFMATHAEIDAQRLREIPQQAHTRRLAFAATGVAVLAAPTIGIDLYHLAEPQRALGKEFFATTRKRRCGVVELRVGAAVGDPRLGALALVRELSAQRLARHCAHRARETGRYGLVGGVGVDRARAVSVLDHERGALAHAPSGVDRTQFIGRERVAVIDIRSAKFDRLAEAPLRIHAARPEVRAALIDFVADAQGDGVEVSVEGRQRLCEQDATRERLEAVVDEPR